MLSCIENNVRIVTSEPLPAFFIAEPPGFVSGVDVIKLPLGLDLLKLIINAVRSGCNYCISIGGSPLHFKLCSMKYITF